jgi:hypothetical protein
MTEPRDPDEDYRALIRAEHDRQRRNLIGTIPLVIGGPSLVIAFCAVIAGLVQGVWFWSALAGGVVALGLTVWGVILVGRSEPSDETLRLAKATPGFEKIQQGRTHWMMYVFILIFGLMPMSMGAAWDVVSGEGNFARAINAAIGLMLVSMPVVVLTGRDGSITPKMRKYLDDEHTQAIRTQAMSLGFVVLMLGASAVYLLGLWRKESAVVLILPVMAMAAFVAVLRFALLERAAERGDDAGG